MDMKVSLEERMMRATARAEAAAIRCEKLAELLELKIAESEERPGRSHYGTGGNCRR